MIEQQAATNKQEQQLVEENTATPTHIPLASELQRHVQLLLGCTLHRLPHSVTALRANKG
ncbi:MAG TPA: hypothetical protein V6C97_27285 [Oculatellaceae cyanobacterium]